MRRRAGNWSALAAIAAMALAVPVMAKEAPLSAAAHPECKGKGVAVDGNFEQAGFAGCRVTASGMVVLSIRPEVTPINPSPWYAARLTQSKARERQVELDYGDAKHRYRPWMRIGDGEWRRLTVRADAAEQGRTVIDLPAFTGQLYLAAQPLRPLAGVMAQWRGFAEQGAVTTVATVESREGRTVPLFRHGPADAAHLHVFTARQHPPETTGAAAFDAFAMAMLAQQPAKRCSGHAFLFAPILNPDGIARGHWRANVGGIDLNRDWDKLSQPEVAGMRSAIVAAVGSAKIVSVLDFHSTRSDALYSPVAPTLAAQSFAAAAATLGLRTVPTRSSTPDTLKSWAEARLGAAAFTVELADDHSPEAAAALGRDLASTFLNHLACAPTGETR